MTNGSGHLNDLSDDFKAALLESSMEDTTLQDIRQAFNSPLKNADGHTLRRALELVRMIETASEQSGQQKWFDPEGPYPITALPKHAKFFEASKNYHEIMFMAGNRVGKTLCGAYAVSCHATGEYPSWWNGRVFDEPTKVWCVGADARQVRDVIQSELLGPVGQWGTGLIPAHRIGKMFALQGTPQAIDVLMVKHKSGGWSQIGFKNYQQDIKSFMGTSRDVVWLDEEAPIDIANECNIRTATTDGLMLYTFTPLSGLTPMVVDFCKNAEFLVGAKPIVAVDQTLEGDTPDGERVIGNGRSKAVIQAGWNDALWLTPETKERLLANTPESLRKARSEGLPAMGMGNVYTAQVDDVLVDPFAIPPSWPKMYALDVGWNRTAAIWAALDPATDTIYFYDEHYLGKEEPPIHAYAIRSRGEWMTGVIDPASRGRSPTDGKQLIQMYRDLGLELFEAKNDVEAGIAMMGQRLSARKIKVFKTLVNFQREYMLYRRDKNGKVVKENDHLLDCARYVVLNLKRMASQTDNYGPAKGSYTPPRYKV